MKTVNDILEYYPATKTNLGFDGMWYKDEVIQIAEEYADQFKQKWISVTERLPEVDQSDEWRNKQGHSKVVPVIESGILNLGWYNYQFEGWQVNGRIGNIQVTEWFDLPLHTKT